MDSLHTGGPAVNDAPPFDWRARLPIHPAAELFPLMAEAELRELAEDIKTNGLRSSIVLIAGENGKDKILDGRNRLDALARLGRVGFDEGGRLRIKREDCDCWDIITFRTASAKTTIGGCEPYSFVLSANLHRRHLNAEQKRDLIAKLLKAKPEASNLSIAKQTKADDKTVASVRRELEGRSEIPNAETRTDATGREQPAKKPPKKIAKAGAVADTKDDAEQPKAAQAAAEKAGVSGADTALKEFDSLIGRLLQKARKAEPKRFAKTGFPSDELKRLSEFLEKVALARLMAAAKRPPPEPTPKPAARDLFQDWRKLPLSELEHRIETIQGLAGKGHHYDDAQWKQLDCMRKRQDELRATEERLVA